MSLWPRLIAGILLLTAAGLGVWKYLDSRPAQVEQAAPPQREVRAASADDVRRFCGTACHAYPPPDSFPRWAWRKEVEQGFNLFKHSKLDLQPPVLAEVIAYYEQRAPQALPAPHRPAPPGPPTLPWQRRGCPSPKQAPFPEVVSVQVVRLSGAARAHILVGECDALKNKGRVLVCNPHTEPPTWKLLADVPALAHVDTVDLDGDGHTDILVACLGRFFPTDDKVGSVVWLRGRAGGFDPITLLQGVGRVADVQAADFNGDGKLDLVVAEFGWRETGAILVLENRTADWSQPRFVPHRIDPRHGAINVPVADLNGDGKPDFVALISQEHETVVAFLSDGAFRFRAETIYTAPHPAYGSSGIRLADLDDDGDLDVVYTNGDTLDKPFLLKPYHGVHWLENEGRYPFTSHRLADMPGVQRAVVGDVDGDGDRDIVAVSYLPLEELPRSAEGDHDAVLFLEQTAKGNFVRRPLATKTCDHFACALGDLFGDGRRALVVGSFWSAKERPLADMLSIWTHPSGRKR